MHWFESQLAELDCLAENYLLSQQHDEADIVNISENTRSTRNKFIDAVQGLVNKICKIKGITACAAYHDGLILAHSEPTLNIDGHGALVQECIQAAEHGNAILKLGHIEQIVIVGAENKVAMLSVGPLILCISSPKHINLALALSGGA